MSDRKKNIVLLTASLLFSLLLAEIVLRCFVDQETKRLAVYDRELGWTGRPNGEGVYIRKKDNIRTSFRYNELGFRDEGVSEKVSGTTRVLLLGDSFLESLEVEYEQIFHELFETNLNANGTDRYDVVNVSSQGYSTAQELLALRKYRDIVRPDVVMLVIYTGNDFADNLRSDFAYLDDEGNLQFVKPESSTLTDLDYSFRRWIYEQSHLVFYLKNTYESLTNQRVAANGKAARSATREEMNVLMYRLIAETQKETESIGSLFGVVLITSREELKDQDLRRTDVVAEACAALAVPVLDLRSVLRTEHFFLNDGHFNPDGHSLTAEKLYSFFMKTYVEGRDG